MTAELEALLAKREPQASNVGSNMILSGARMGEKFNWPILDAEMKQVREGETQLLLQASVLVWMLLLMMRHAVFDNDI